MTQRDIRVGPRERKILAFIRGVAKKTHNAPFSPQDLVEAGYKEDKRVLQNALPKLARKGFLTKLCKGVYKVCPSGKRIVTKPENKTKPLVAPKRPSTVEEWRIRLDAAMQRQADAVESCNRKMQECHDKIEETKEDARVHLAEKTKAEKALDELRKTYDVFQKSPEGFALVMSTNLV